MIAFHDRLKDLLPTRSCFLSLSILHCVDSILEANASAAVLDLWIHSYLQLYTTEIPQTLCTYKSPTHLPLHPRSHLTAITIHLCIPWPKTIHSPIPYHPSIQNPSSPLPLINQTNLQRRPYLPHVARLNHRYHYTPNTEYFPTKKTLCLWIAHSMHIHAHEHDERR